MKCRTTWLALWLALAAAPAAVAQQPPHQPQPPEMPHGPDDPIGQNLFPPDLIMRYQQDIALQPEQRAAITKSIQEFQNKTVELQWQMQDQTQRLVNLLSKPSVDETAALTQLDQMLNVEREVKRAHIGLLIKLKNTLSAEQQAKLAMHREGGGS